jgi:hypothetical protein
MVVVEQYEELKRRLEELLADVDRLGLPYVGVHLDMALRRLEEKLVQEATKSTPTANSE